MMRVCALAERAEVVYGVMLARKRCRYWRMCANGLVHVDPLVVAVSKLNAEMNAEAKQSAVRIGRVSVHTRENQEVYMVPIRAGRP